MAQIWDFNNRNFWIFESYNNSSSLFIYFVYFACLFLVPSVFYQTFFYYLNRQPGSSPCTWLPIECPLKIIYFHCKPSLLPIIRLICLPVSLLQIQASSLLAAHTLTCHVYTMNKWAQHLKRWNPTVLIFISPLAICALASEWAQSYLAPFHKPPSSFGAYY